MVTFLFSVHTISETKQYAGLGRAEPGLIWPGAPWCSAATEQQQQQQQQLQQQQQEKQTLYQVWAKLNNPPLSYWRFSYFSTMNRIFKLSPSGGGWWTKLRQTWRERSSIIAPPSVLFWYGYVTAFRNEGGSETSCVERRSMPNFTLFNPSKN